MTIIYKVRKWLESYVVFAEEGQSTAVATWALATHLWPHFDAFPYLTITARTKRCGKTRLGIELCGFIAANANNLSGTTSAALFRKINADKPTVLIDEAESMSSEQKNSMQMLLNLGYRRGQKITRVSGKTGTIQYDVYCPKVFCLIGDINDTVRDRSIVITLQRGEPKKHFVYTKAEAEGKALREEMSAVARDLQIAILAAYETEFAPYMVSDRDEEIWRPLLATIKTVAPKEYSSLRRTAVDIATEKTIPASNYGTLKGQEIVAEERDYAVKLLRDAMQIFTPADTKSLRSSELLERLYALDLSPWRKFRGDGLDMNTMSRLLGLVGVRLHNKPIRRGKEVFRGYTRTDIIAAYAKL